MRVRCRKAALTGGRAGLAFHDLRENRKISGSPPGSFQTACIFPSLPLNLAQHAVKKIPAAADPYPAGPLKSS